MAASRLARREPLKQPNAALHPKSLPRAWHGGTSSGAQPLAPQEYFLRNATAFPQGAIEPLLLHDCASPKAPTVGALDCFNGSETVIIRLT